ncbi:hypothetical protein [Virgibacillus litoralis]|uniref:DUF2524 domain-containing protein n=1 Tax=Virgibacillus litoralis TaxID=578221 RepID=A0ABS4HH22_9BACI|nr:hypothetical protein [Virgibacillus litoralis]MBP1950211.1 hypothetical protein [Virgibacillus litoralis]
MHSNNKDMETVMEYMNSAKLAVEKAQEDQTGFSEAQQQVKLAEEILNEAKHNPVINNQVNAREMQRATDLLRLIEETNQAINHQT